MKRDIIKKYKKKVKKPMVNGHLNIKAASRSRIIQTLWNNTLTTSENAQQITAERIREYLPTTYTELPPPTLPPAEFEICQMLQMRYGDDYKRMARDIKINRWQWNKLECEKRIAKLQNHH